jgi:hypothetical protein
MITEELPHVPAEAETRDGGCATSKKLYFISDLWYKSDTQTLYHVICGEVART